VYLQKWDLIKKQATEAQGMSHCLEEPRDAALLGIGMKVRIRSPKNPLPLQLVAVHITLFLRDPPCSNSPHNLIIDIKLKPKSMAILITAELCSVTTRKLTTHTVTC
jgi:hypothetical protein